MFYKVHRQLKPAIQVFSAFSNAENHLKFLIRIEEKDISGEIIILS